MAFLLKSPQNISLTPKFLSNSFHQRYKSPFNVSISTFDLPKTSPSWVLRLSNQAQSLLDSFPTSQVPIFSCEEAIERLRLSREKHKGKQEFMAMYSSVFGGITTDPTAMVIPIDDHMVHRGHGVFDTATLVDGHLYELDQHLDRCLRSASMAKITPPFNKETMRTILIQTVSASKCKNGSLRYWLSAGPGDFLLSPSGCAESSFYAVVYQGSGPLGPPSHNGIKVITSSIPIKPPVFATMKSVNYLPNALCQMEAEENGCFASIWLDSEGFVAEGPNMNVGFVTREKELLVPRFDKVLSGCTAKRVLKLAQVLVEKGEIRGVSMRDVSVEEGKKAEEMMFFGSGVLVVPIVQWDDKVIGDGNEGPVAQSLLDLLLKDMKSGPTTVRIPVPY